MKKTLLILGLAAIFGCSEKPAAETKVAATFNIEQGTYYNDKGTMSISSWKASDKVGMYIVGNGEKKFSSSPILPGDKKSMFLFSIIGQYPENVTAVGYYPYNMDITPEDNTVKLTLPTEQDGRISPCMFGKASGNLSTFKDKDLALKHIYSTMKVNIAKGAFSVSELEFKANGNEGIAGEVTLDLETMKTTATASSITVRLKNPVDCSEGASISFSVAPGKLAGGYTVTIRTSTGETMTIEEKEAVTFVAAGKHESGKASSNKQTKLYICGDEWIYLIDADLANENGYRDAVLWSWNAKDHAEEIGITKNNAIRLDDCKPVDNGRKILATSSRGYCALIDVETGKVLFSCNNAPNAHSAELLPNNRVVVACSESTQNGKEVGQKIQIYDLDKPNNVQYETPCANAHGVVWSEKYQRLYALGYDSKGFIDIYKLTGWNTTSPKLTLDKRVNTPTGGTHDLMTVNENILSVAGVNAYLYNIETNSFTELMHFRGTSAMKSLNYNDETGAIWYTDSTKEHRDNPAWSPTHVCYVPSGDAVSVARKISVPDIILYKVRVLNW